jgi:uncharacterized glyoxalase superfamily protein PhnB
MEKVNVPAGYQQVMPYLIIPDAKGFLQFAKTVFGATEKMIVPREDNTIMHGELLIGEQVIMFAESSDQYPATPGAFFIYVDDADAKFKLSIQHGAKEIEPITDKDYGRSGGVKDAHGNTWWLTSQK